MNTFKKFKYGEYIIYAAHWKGSYNIVISHPSGAFIIVLPSENTYIYNSRKKDFIDFIKQL